MTRKSVIAVAAAVVAAGAAFGVAKFRSSRLSVMHAKRGPITEAVYGLGRVKSRHRFEVKLGVMSTLKRLHVREGDPVKAGDKLAEFEDSRTVFRSPIGGTVTYVGLHDGEIAVPNMAVLRIEDLKDRYIELSLEQEGALRVKPGQMAKISFEARRGQTLNGKVTALIPQEDEFLAHIQVENLGENVLPGMTADVSVEIGQIPDALLIPVKAVNNGTVLVQRNRKRQKVAVELGHMDGLWAELKSGNLTVDDELLVASPAAGK